MNETPSNPESEMAGAGGPAGLEHFPPSDDAKTWSVTRHREITIKENSEVKDWTILSQGIDTLDLGLWVFWGIDWPKRLEELEAAKTIAVGKGKIHWKEINGDQIYISASGKPPMYRFHLIASIGEIYIGKSKTAKKTPNVYVSLKAFALWERGIAKCTIALGKLIRALGGTICYMQPSRVDMCVDSHIPKGISSDFLREHIVSHARENRQHASGDTLETYTLGNTLSPVQLRIYEKTKKASQDNTLTLFWKVWNAEMRADVWRFEYQIRRPFLQSSHINSIGALRSLLGALWKFFTEHWCSLREIDDTNTTRRSVHPFWLAVQERAELFGECLALNRRKGPLIPADADWHLAHIAGCITSYGAFRGHDSWRLAVQDVIRQLGVKKSELEYDSTLRVKLTELGREGVQFENPFPEEPTPLDGDERYLAS